MSIFNNCKVVRVIDIFRKKYPGKWKYINQEKRWQCDDGSWIWACATLSPRYDGDDDTFTTQYWRYFPDNRSPELVNLWY